MDFIDKVVVITGASSGIGATAAILFAKQSAKLVLVGRNEANLKSVAEKCEKENGIKPLIVKAELNNDDEVERIVTETVKVFGRIDVLVNNAAVGVRGSIKDGVKLYDKAMNGNMRPVYLLTSLAVPYLIKNKGNIVNVSSVAAFKPVRGIDFMPYCISKAALDQFTRCVALELASDGVRVNSVNPGVTNTPFQENAGLNKDQVKDVRTFYEKVLPLKKMTESEDVADLILYLANDRARSITGAIHVIDNGEILA